MQEKSKALWKSVDDHKRELEQKTFAQRQQVSKLYSKNNKFFTFATAKVWSIGLLQWYVYTLK